MFFTETGISNASFVIFVLAKNYRSPSSMDRIKDSGSFDMGSNPVGITKKPLFMRLLLFLRNKKGNGATKKSSALCEAPN